MRKPVTDSEDGFNARRYWPGSYCARALFLIVWSSNSDIERVWQTWGSEIVDRSCKGNLGLALSAALCMAAALAAGRAFAYSIPADAVDSQQIYWGTPSSFETPAMVSMDAVIEATPEYKEITRKKLEKGTARYWILLSQASDRAIRAISEVGANSEYDLIAETGYLGSLDPPIPATDITELVIETL